jgi:hypothetical protein
VSRTADPSSPLTAPPPRPLGVWILCALQIAVAIKFIHDSSPGLMRPLPHGWDESSAAFTPYFIGLYLCTIGAAIGAWLGIKAFRTALLILVAVPIYFFVRDDVAAIVFFLVQGQGNPRPSVPVRWILALAPVPRVLWLGFNCWYFLGPRTRLFYSRTGRDAREIIS